MTALPKHWPSSRRQGKRRASFKATQLSQVTLCKNCGQPKIPGFTCKNCNK